MTRDAASDYRIVVILQDGEVRQTSFGRLLEVLGIEGGVSGEAESQEGGWRVYLVAKLLKAGFSEVETVRVYDLRGRQIHAIL